MTPSLREQAEAWIKPHTPECELAADSTFKDTPWASARCTCPREAFLAALLRLEQERDNFKRMYNEVREGIRSGFLDRAEAAESALSQIAAEKKLCQGVTGDRPAFSKSQVDTARTVPVSQNDSARAVDEAMTTASQNAGEEPAPDSTTHLAQIAAELADTKLTLAARTSAVLNATRRQDELTREVAQLAAYLADIGGALLDLGTVKVGDASTYADAIRQLAAERDRLKALVKALADRHEGYGLGMGQCMCEAHIQARKVLSMDAALQRWTPQPQVQEKKDDARVDEGQSNTPRSGSTAASD